MATLGLAVLVGLQLAGGCARPRAPARPDAAAAAETPERDERDARQAVVVVENRNWSDVVISLSRSGRLTRIGTVSANSTATLRFPATWTAGAVQLQLAARAIGGRATLRSESFMLHAGQRAEWTLENKLTRASLAIF